MLELCRTCVDCKQGKSSHISTYALVCEFRHLNYRIMGYPEDSGTLQRPHMLLVKAPSETKLQTSSKLSSTSSKVWNGSAWKIWPDFHFYTLGSCCLPHFTGLVDLKRHSSVRPAIPSMGCTLFTGAELAHRAEQCCWRRSPILSAHLVLKPVGQSR